jgi:hypothetical protein
MATIAELIGKIFSDWRKFLRAVAMFAILVLTGAWLVRGVLLILGDGGLTAREVEFSKSPRIVLQQATPRGTEYLVVVQPQAWQDTDIPIAPGDELEIHAEGRINISLNGLFESVRKRHVVERRIRAKEGVVTAGSDAALLPERFYTPADHDSVRLTRPWVGPNGYGGGSAGIRDASYPARTKNKLLPEAPFGALVGTVHQQGNPPARYDGFSDAFLIGEARSVTWAGPRGELWFAINDVWDDEDPRFPDKFYADNIGFFLVRVKVQHR